jgi:hypothetical protein
MRENEIHVERSLIFARKNFPELFALEMEVVIDLIKELHGWLDYYDSRKGKDDDGPFDFTGARNIRHRAKRHHIEGFREAVKLFTEKYGEKFTNLIRQEAERHIKDDMGQILSKSDYEVIGFWKNYPSF